MAADLSTSARQALIALMVRADRVSNPELRAGYRLEVTKAARTELAREGLISWEKGARNAIFYELTDRGWQRARQEFRSPPPDRVAGAWLLHYATLRHLHALMERADLKIADIYADPDPGPDVPSSPESAPSPVSAPASLEDRVRAAYLDVAARPGDLVRLALIRDRLSDVDRGEQDRILTGMDRRREIYLESDPGRNELTPEAAAAALHVGGEDLHLIRIGRA